jgi:hypothetical protein
MATPSKVTAPWLGRSRPAQIAINVVLPLPDGPTMAQVLPASMANEISLKTLISCSPLLKTLLKCSTVRMSLVMLEEKIEKKADEGQGQTGAA